MGPRYPLLIPAHTGQPLPARVDLSLKPEAAPPPHTPLFNNLGVWRAGTGLPDEGRVSCLLGGSRQGTSCTRPLFGPPDRVPHPPTLRCT